MGADITDITQNLTLNRKPIYLLPEVIFTGALAVLTKRFRSFAL